MDNISNSVKNVEPPRSVTITETARSLEDRESDIIKLGKGEPHFETPTPVKEELFQAVEDGITNYTENAGIKIFRDRAAKKFQTENNIPTKPENIIVTPGAKQALFLTIRTLVDPGDEILIPDPGWTSYSKMVRLAGGTPVLLSGEPKNDFIPDQQLIEGSISNNTAAIIVNTPGNPTGAVWDKSDLLNVVRVCEEKDVFVISDEIYEHFVYDDQEHISIGSIDDMHERTITINGFSKSHAMTGWRLGYLAAPETIREHILNVHIHLNSCATSFVQKAGVKAFDCNDHLNSISELYGTNRDHFIHNFPLPVIPPQGGFYCLIDVTNIADDETELAQKMLTDIGVALTPGRTYGPTGKGYLRASYALPESEVQKAIERITDWLN